MNREYKETNPLADVSNHGEIISKWKEFVKDFDLEGYVYMRMLREGKGEKEIEAELQARKQLIAETRGTKR